MEPHNVFINNIADRQYDWSSSMHWMECFPDIIIAFSNTGQIFYINNAGIELLGYQLLELKNMDMAMWMDKEYKTEFDRHLVNETLHDFICKMWRKDGSICYVSWSSFKLKEIKALFISGKDVTNVIHIHQKKLAKDHLLQALIDNSFDLLALTDENGNYKFVSQSLTQLFGYGEQELLGKNCFDYIHPDDLPRILEQFHVLLYQDKKIHVPPYRFKSAGGDWLWMEAIVTNQLSHPDLQGVVVSVRDITPRMVAEEKVKDMQLLQALMEGEEKERSRIARDLHDGIAGMIAAAKMHFSSLSSTISSILESKGYVQGMDLLENASIQVRRTSHNLMPEILLENGLEKAIDRYCTSISNRSLQLLFIPLGNINRFNAGFELALYRIVQELINNIIRHSKATQALVQLSQNQNILTLSVEDNGDGFLTENITDGTGLGSIRKRVNALTGHLEICSQINKGTQVYLEFELRNL